MNQLIGSTLDTLFRHQLLLIQLFAGAKTGILNLDVNIRLISGKLDQVARQSVNLNRFTHVKHEDLAALCIGTCLKHKAYGLGNCHKITDNIRMGNGNGTSLGNLFLK